MKGQIISPKKQGSRGPFIKNRDKEKDKDKEKSSLYSAASSNSSKMYMQGDDTSSRSILSMEYESSRRPVSSRNAFYGRNGSARLSPDDASDVGSVLGLGHQWGNYDGHHHRHIHHHADHHYSGGFEFGLDDDRTDIDIIQAIFNKPETPPPAPDLVPDSEARASYFPKQTQEISSNAAHTAPLHSDSNHSEASENSRHRSPAQALAFLHRSKDKSGKGKQASLAHLGVEDVKGRKRVASAPSRSLFPPLRSGSRASQPVSVTSDDGAVESPDSRDAHHHHHGHHDDTLGPVVVHIPTRQEPIDIHSHPFRWKGKASATMHEATQVLHAVHTVADEIGTTLPVMEHDKHRAASVNIANLESDAAGSGNEGAKRRAPASAAAHIFRLPFKNRSSSALSSTASLQSAAPILEAGSSSRRIPDVDHETYERNSKTTSDIPRGSLDLQRTIRPSSEGDPTRANIRRMTSPTTMTATEEADLQSYVAEQLHSDTKASSSVKSGQKTTFSKDLPRSFQSQAQSVEAPRARAASSQLKSDLNAVPSPNSHTSSLSEEDQSDEDVDQTDLVRQVTNEEALGERARRLRDRGLLPTLSVTRSDELPARFPDAAPEL